MKYTAVIGIALLFGSVPAIAQPHQDLAPPQDQCLRQRNIYDFQTVPGNRSLVVSDISRRRYRLTFVGACYNLQHQFGLAFRSRGVGTLSCIERGDSILMRDPVGPNECIIHEVRPQTVELDRMDREAARNRARR